MYLGNAKSGTTSVKKQFDLIKNKDSIEIPNSDSFTKEYLQSIQDQCDTLEKFVLFFHVREPWDRFLSAIATDIKRSENLTVVEERCEEIKNKYGSITPNDPNSVQAAGLELNFTPVLETVYKVILLTLPPMRDRIQRIDVWNYGSLKESMEKSWNCEFVVRENVTPNTIKNTVYDFFEKETRFKKEWMEKNKKDYELYTLVKNKSSHSVSCKEYINKFYEKL
jgi:CRISPR/Cas system CMR-associated protein Cmr5 small subunit